MIGSAKVGCAADRESPGLAIPRISFSLTDVLHVDISPGVRSGDIRNT